MGCNENACSSRLRVGLYVPTASGRPERPDVYQCYEVKTILDGRCGEFRGMLILTADSFFVEKSGGMWRKICNFGAEFSLIGIDAVFGHHRSEDRPKRAVVSSCLVSQAIADVGRGEYDPAQGCIPAVPRTLSRKCLECADG